MRSIVVSMPRRERGERGAVATMVAISLTALLIVVAMILDFGLVRLDRQSNKAAADAAVAAGMRGLDGGTGEVYSYRGVCEAIDYLNANEPDLKDAGLAWSQCNGSKDSVVCEPAASSTWARFEQTLTTASDVTYTVQVRIPYTEADMAEFEEESKTTLTSDQGETAEAGCDQLGVNITEVRKPGLGSIASTDDITSRVRSVGRITIGQEGEGAVALLLLERHDCRAIDTNGGASVQVLGNDDMPGMIHTDSLGDGDNCSSSDKIYNGNHSSGIVAEASDDGTESGLLTTRALSGALEAVAANAADPIGFVHGGPYPPGTAPEGRDLITRRPIDNRYLDAVRTQQANGYAKTVMTPTAATAAGYTVSTGPGGCTLDATERAAVRLYVDCPGPPGFTQAGVSLPNATEVIFNGKVSADNLQMPRATGVYVYGDWGGGPGGAVGFDIAPEFRMHHFGASTCSETPTGDPNNRAVLFIAGGNLRSNTSSAELQMCGTTLVMGGAQVNGCIPATNGADPVDNNCRGFLQITGGGQDWTAPNSTSDQADVSLWSQFEDLALWTEAFGSHTIAGGGNMHLAGVFMLPEADAFNIKGGGLQDVENSQYIARKLNATGGGTLTMKPNAKDVVTIPILGGFSMVR